MLKQPPKPSGKSKVRDIYSLAGLLTLSKSKTQRHWENRPFERRDWRPKITSSETGSTPLTELVETSQNNDRMEKMFMDQIKEQLQKWKVAGVVFLFFAVWTSPAWAKDLQHYCYEEKDKAKPKCVRALDDCTAWTYRDAYCYGRGTNCEPQEEGEEPANLGYYRKFPRECTIGRQVRIIQKGRIDFWNTPC